LFISQKQLRLQPLDDILNPAFGSTRITLTILALYFFVSWGCDKSSAAPFADTQKTLPLFFIPNAIENIKPHFETVSFPAVRAKLRWHLITPFPG